MAIGWHPTRLGELVAFKTGKLDSNAAVRGGRYPFFTCSQETFRTNTYSFDTECVLLAGNNANGIFPLKYFKGKFDAYQRTYVLTPRDPRRLVTKFLYYALRPKLAEFRSVSTGAATKFLTMGILNETEIQIPTPSIQRRIASILGAYDDLIEVNRRRIAVLEEMARRLFDEWFINFRFPGHETAPCRDTSNGPLPQGWTWGELGDLLVLRRDGTKPGIHLAERKYVPIECIDRRTLALSKSEPLENAQSSLQLFERGDLLFGAMRAYFHKVAPAPFAGVTRATCFVLRPRSPELFSYSTLTLFQDATVSFAAAKSKGSTIPYAQWSGVMEKMPLPRPPQKLLEAFDTAVRPSIELIMKLTQANGSLTASRDLLLPRFISGELSVATAERELEDAA